MSDQPFDPLYEHSTAAILTVTPEGRVIDCNRLAHRLLMRGREEIVGSSLETWFTGPERGLTLQHLRTACTGVVTEWYTSVPRIEGTRRQVIVRLVPATRGAVERIHALIVTPVQAGSTGAGEALRPLLENLPNQFALVLDLEYRIRYATGLARTHWLNPEDVLGAELGRLLEPAEANATQLADMRSELEAGRAWTGRERHRRADGSWILVDAFALPHRDSASGIILGALYAGRDVSAEHELRVRSERADRFAAIGDVVVSVAVELQRALNRVNDLSTSEAGPGPGFTTEVYRASELVEKLLAFASTRPLEPTDIALTDIVDHVLKQLEPEIDAAGVRVSTRVSSGLPLLRLDEGHLTRILRELLQNGIEAMNTPGTMDRELRVMATREGDLLILAIEDRGPGIPAAVADRVFDAFYTTRHGRFGLGLPIVRGIVSAHDGRIAIRPLPTGGTRVVVQLPIRASRAGARFRAVPLILRSRSVLLVEDDENVRAVIRRALETTGYRVTEAFSGRSALTRLTTGEVPDLIITDLKMAGGNGYWLIDKLRSDFPALHSRTLIITGDASVGALDEIERITGCPALAKPVPFPVLLEAMDELLTRADRAGAPR